MKRPERESATATNIRAIIAQKGLKQCAVAEKAGFSIKAFNNMLNGRRLIADYDILSIIKALDVTPNDLFGKLD